MFEKLKQNLMKRIEQNSVVQDLTYTDRDGTEYTEKVYLKRGKGKLGDWHQVYLPIKDDGTNRWHISNALFGGRRNLIRLIFYLLLAGIVFLAFKEVSSNYQVLMNNPCVLNCVNKVIGG